LRKYIDHTLIEVQSQKNSKDMRLDGLNVHNSICVIQYKLGHLDESLLSLVECMMQAQNKGDN